MPGAVAILASESTGTSKLLDGLERLALDVRLVPPLEARREVAPGETAIARLDVLPTLDGVEPGLLELLWLERSGAVRVLNGARSLLAAHDKLRTARTLRAAGVPVPRTAHVRSREELAGVGLPVVVKPRFGSWGRGIERCRRQADLERVLAEVPARSWFRRHGAIVQELLPPAASDLRVLVAAGVVVGAGTRFPAPGEWRTNVSLGGTLAAADPPPAARSLALAAALATGADLVGVDLYPLEGGRWLVLELNGAVDFDGRYSLRGRDVFLDLAAALRLDLGGDRPDVAGLRLCRSGDPRRA